MLKNQLKKLRGIIINAFLPLYLSGVRQCNYDKLVKRNTAFHQKKYVKIEMVFGYGLRQVGQKILIASHLKFIQTYFEKNHLYLEYYILPVYHVFL